MACHGTFNVDRVGEPWFSTSESQGKGMGQLWYVGKMLACEPWIFPVRIYFSQRLRDEEKILQCFFSVALNLLNLFWD